MKKQKPKKRAAQKKRSPILSLEAWERKTAKNAVTTDPKLFGIAILNPPEAHGPEAAALKTGLDETGQAALEPGRETGPDNTKGEQR